MRPAKDLWGRKYDLSSEIRRKEGKMEVQRSLRNLKGKSEWKGVSIRPDLTKMQYQEEKQVFEDLCQDMKIKNENLQGEGKWKIVNWDGVQKLLFLDNI